MNFSKIVKNLVVGGLITIPSFLLYQYLKPFAEPDIEENDKPEPEKPKETKASSTSNSKKTSKTKNKTKAKRKTTNKSKAAKSKVPANTVIEVDESGRELYQGARGGKYYFDNKGRRIYLKENQPIPKIQPNKAKNKKTNKDESTAKPEGEGGQAES